LKTALSQNLFLRPDGSVKNFGYIDLRFGKKIFYKLDATASVETSASAE
jgi:hypothetical protein